MEAWLRPSEFLSSCPRALAPPRFWAPHLLTLLRDSFAPTRGTQCQAILLCLGPGAEVHQGQDLGLGVGTCRAWE